MIVNEKPIEKVRRHLLLAREAIRQARTEKLRWVRLDYEEVVRHATALEDDLKALWELWLETETLPALQDDHAPDDPPPIAPPPARKRRKHPDGGTVVDHAAAKEA